MKTSSGVPAPASVRQHAGEGDEPVPTAVHRSDVSRGDEVPHDLRTDVENSGRLLRRHQQPVENPSSCVRRTFMEQPASSQVLAGLSTRRLTRTETDSGAGFWPSAVGWAGRSLVRGHRTAPLLSSLSVTRARSMTSSSPLRAPQARPLTASSAARAGSTCFSARVSSRP